MTEKSYLWTTGGAGDGASTYTRDDWSVISKIFAGAGGDYKGVSGNFLNQLGVNATAANQVTIDTGGAIVDGKPYQNNSTVNVTIPSAVGVGNTRIDTIVLECDWTAQTVRIKRVAGTDAATPSAPSLTQNSGTLWQLPLWNVTVNTSGTVTTSDNRDWARFTWIDSGNSGQFLKRDTSVAAGVSWDSPIVPAIGVRLSLSSTLPYPNSDILTATTLYLLPVFGGLIELWTGTAWSPYQLTGSGISVSLVAISNNTNYDVFGYLVGGAPALELTAWSSATARTTALAWSAGRLIKAGDATRRYLGTIRASAAGQCEDSAVKRFVWNYFNPSGRLMYNTASGSHNYATAANRWWNNSSTGSSVEFVTGYDGGTSPINAPKIIMTLSILCSLSQFGAYFGFWNGTNQIGLGKTQSTINLTQLTIEGYLHPSVSSWNFAGYQRVGVYEYGNGSGNLTSNNVELETIVEG